MTEHKSPILRFSQKELTELFESGDAKIVSTKKEALLKDMLVQSESNAWEKFLGAEIDIPEPPPMLFNVWYEAIIKGITSFKSHYLPMLSLGYKGSTGGFEPKLFPGWKERPEDWYWYQIENSLDVDSPKLGGRWILIDVTQKPNFKQDYSQMYENDPLKDFLINLKRQGKFNQLHNIPDGSRYGIRQDIIHTRVLPELAKGLSMSPDKIRLPRAIEFNIIGNMFHPEWGKTNTSEFFEDQFGIQALIGGDGDAVDNGLTKIFRYPTDTCNPIIGFRPMIVFPLDIARGKS